MPGDSASSEVSAAASADEAFAGEMRCGQAIPSRSAAISGWRISDPEQHASPRLGAAAAPALPHQRIGEQAGRRPGRLRGEPARPANRRTAGARQLAAPALRRTAVSTRSRTAALVVPADIGVADRRHGAREAPAPGRRGAPAWRDRARAPRCSQSMSISGFAASSIFRNASGPSRAEEIVGILPVRQKREPARSCPASDAARPDATARKAAFSPASSPSKQRTGSSAICQSMRSWSSVSAVPSGATVASKPAATQAITSI